jgi:Cd2+/Zn2+-exporting ATPase
MAASLARGVREGILFKGGVFMESLSKVRTFAFDKTGTLTHGEPQVVDIREVSCQGDPDCDSCDDLLALAYALERHSTHPLAQAIIKEAEKRDVADRYPAAAGLTIRGGLGLEGYINGRLMTIGSLRLFEEEHHIPPMVHNWVEKAESEGKTAMLLCDGEGVRGFIAVSDSPRASSKPVIRALKKLGKRTIMLTGDNQTVAGVIAAELDMDAFRSDLLPGEKQQAVAELRSRYEVVAMVGDGINDAPALAEADIGIAVDGGSTQAMETADVVLLGNDIDKLPFAIRLSGFANHLVKENIAFSLTSKLLVAVIALLGYAPLWLAVVADMGVSLLVTLNGLRALRFKA